MQDVVRAWARQYADEVRTDRHGNVIAVRRPREATANTQRSCSPATATRSA